MLSPTRYIIFRSVLDVFFFTKNKLPQVGGLKGSGPGEPPSVSGQSKLCLRAANGGPARAGRVRRGTQQDAAGGTAGC